jgi:hypothetical protein
MKYIEIEDDKQEPGPDRNIVIKNDNIFRLLEKIDLGIVLFEDEKIREKYIIITLKSRKIVLFFPCILKIF